MNTILMPKILAVGVVAVTAGACTVQGRTGAYVEEPVSTVEVTSAPVVYETYPHTVYEGRTVYYVDNRWGYPRGSQWVYYRSEPPPLVRYRTNVHTNMVRLNVQEAPPAPRRHSPPASAPPAYRTR